MEAVKNKVGSIGESAQIAGASLLPSGSLQPEYPGSLLLNTEVEKPVEDEDSKTEQIGELVKQIITNVRVPYICLSH